MASKSQVYIDLLVGRDNEHLWSNAWFLNLGINMSRYVENKAINFANKGTIPGVTKNPTYPLTKINRSDIPNSIPLAPYASDEFVLPKIDLHALPYDKRATLLVDHRAAMLNLITSEGIWNVSPYENTTNTPLEVSTGAADANGNKLIIGADIVRLRKALNKKFPGLKQAPWHLVLDTDSYWDLVANDPTIKAQLQYKNTVGDVNVGMINYQGFIIHEDDRTPWYDGTTEKRLAHGSTPVLGTDIPAATAFVANKTFASALGKTEFFDNPKDSSFQADMGSFLMHGYVGPLSSDLQSNLTFMGGILRKA